MKNLKLFENFDEGEMVLIMLNDEPFGLTRNNEWITGGIEQCLVDVGGYSEVVIEEIEVSDHPDEMVRNLCYVDGSKVNLFLLKVEMFPL